MLRENVTEKIEAIYPRLVKIRQELHQYPERAFREYQTAEYLKKVLQKEGIPYEMVGKTGIIATIRSENTEKTVAMCEQAEREETKKQEKILALRADMDALPMKEETNLAWHSENGMMHSCGHDMHMTMVLGAGIILNQEKKNWKGTIKLIFQPAEEIGEGAQTMIESGKLSGIDTILALHMNPQEPTGKFLTGYGARTTQGICIDILFRKKEQEKRQAEHIPAFAATRFIELVEKRKESETKFQNRISLAPTIIRTGQNGDITLFYDGRTFCDADRDRLESIIEYAAGLVQNSCPVIIQKKTERIGGSVQNDTQGVKKTEEVLTSLFGENSWEESPPAMFGEDFRCYANVIPHSVFSMLGGSDGEKRYGLHNCHVTFDNRALKYGVGYYVGYVMKE